MRVEIGVEVTLRGRTPKAGGGTPKGVSLLVITDPVTPKYKFND